jgi:hypothetical protein
VRAMQHDEGIRAPVPWLFRTAFRVAAAEMRRDRHLAPVADQTERDHTPTIDLLDALRGLPPGQRATLFSTTTRTFRSGRSPAPTPHRARIRCAQSHLAHASARMSPQVPPWQEPGRDHVSTGPRDYRPVVAASSCRANHRS